jgi:glucose/arabinose dehydrogenase
VYSLALAACGGADDAPLAQNSVFTVSEVAQFNEPWAMEFLPDGRLLVSEKRGALKLHTIGGQTGEIRGVPEVSYGGQGGFGDVVLHPRFADNDLVYVSYAEPGSGGTAGAAVARAELALDAGGGGELENLTVVWRQVPKVDGRGHYAHRIAFGPDGRLWISSGDRQKFDPAQDMRANLGKILRLNDDGSVPADNPLSIEPPNAGASRRRFGPSVIAIHSVSHSILQADLGTSRWARAAATSSISCNAARTTATRSFPMAITTMAETSPITPRGRSSQRPRFFGIP